MCTRKIGREHSTYCRRNLVCDQPVSQYSIRFGLIIFWHLRMMSLISVDLIVVYWSVLHFILDSTWVWYSLLLELKIPTLSLDYEMHWHCEDNGHIWSSYLSESFVMRCFGIVRIIPTSSSSWPMDHTLDLMVCILSFLRRLWLSLWGRHCFEKTLVYIVDWLLQWSKDFSDTTVFGWPTLTMSDRTFYYTLRLEAVRCYLYVESWFGEGTLCSDYVLYSEEGCTDTLCESLRSWEVSQLVTNEWAGYSRLDENQFDLRTFGSVSMFLNSSSEIEFCRLVAAGIVLTNLYLKNLRFVNWKPGMEFTSWDIGSKDWCQKFI